MPVPKALACGPCKVKEEERNRRVNINVGDPHPHYDNNKTRTTKYTLITFFPKALFEQYRRVANIYFTIVAALSLTEFSPVRPWTTWTPLVIVLGVSMIKEAIEDFKRYKADKEVNNREVEVLDLKTGTFVKRRWMDIKVGEIIITKKDHQFPADVLFLTAENEEGTAYVETMNLDGETNLKIKKALDQTKDYVQDKLQGFKGAIECEGPNARLYQFTGNLLLEPPVVPAPAKIAIGPSAIILRGCNLRNTERVFGAVIYTGHETKIFKNSSEAPSKRSSVERIVDKVIIFMFTLLFCMCITGCVYFALWVKDHYEDAWYLGSFKTNVQYNPDKPVAAAFTNFITVFILYGYLIPISLYVSMEMVKITQSMVFIAKDRQMYHPDTDTPALARTSNLNEELGMVNTVLSDKTGTLTRNVMEFFKSSIAGVSYGAGITEIERSNAARKGVVLPEGEDPAAAKYRERFFNFYDSRLMDGAWHNSPDAPIIEMFLRLLAVCHTVVPDGPQTEDEIKYEAESPDEAALVVAAKKLGFFFFKRTNTTVCVRERTAAGTRDVTYELLNVLEFNSTRKRMSVIVRDDTGRIIIFCKGADTVIYERLDPAHPQNAQLKDLTTQHMEEYGSAGLRTLCLSYAIVDPAFYQVWQEKWSEAKTSLEDRDGKLAAVGEEIEKKLCLLGCTAIEDKLQEGVPQCIKQLAAGGIRLWVLTGDKMETAINIAFACSLITEDMQQFIVSAYCEEVDRLEEEGKKSEADLVGHQRVAEQLKQVQATMRENSGAFQFAMVIDGKALQYGLSERLAPLFLEVGLQCAAVVCCRVSPLQKAQVTSLVRSHGDVTLAIGDGANDVGMIQQAHIGVGISGQEGMQAVMAADFAIAQFRFLTPLLLVHGRWSYKRISRMICFFFYKNLLFGITIFTFNAFTTFSGQYLYNDFYMTLFNVIFTALTPIIIGIFDRDVDREMGLRFPQLYRQGQENQYFGFWPIVGWLLTATYQAGVIMVMMLVGCHSTHIAHTSGQPFTMWETGVLMFSIVVVTVHIEVIQIEEQWTWLHHLAIWLSQAIWWLYLLAYGAFPLSLASDLYHLFVGIVATTSNYWLFLLLVPIACQLPDFFWRQVRRYLTPDDHHIVQEIQSVEAEDRRQGRVRGTGPGQPGQGSADPNAVVLSIFDKKPRNKNTGFVPPYDRRSRFYKLMLSSAGRMAGKGNTQVAAPNGDGGLQTTVRNPVLQHLDQELTNNPMRNKQRTSGMGVRPEQQNGAQGGNMLPLPPAAMPAGSAPLAPGASTAAAVGESHMNAHDASMLSVYTSALR